MTGGRNTPPLGYKSGVIVARMPFKHEALGRNQPFILILLKEKQNGKRNGLLKSWLVSNKIIKHLRFVNKNITFV